jgi:hypothetical protein
VIGQSHIFFADMKLLFSTLFLCVSLIISAQNKYDNNIINGYVSSPNTPDGFVMSFRGDSFDVHTKEVTCNLLRSSMAMSNSNGDLLFYTDGCGIYNYNDELLSDKINNQTGFSNFCSTESNYPVNQGILSIPYPGKHNQYIIFHLYKYEPYTVNELRYTIVDLSINGGEGDIIQENIIIDQKNFADELLAIRHGNGRDWWIIVGPDQTDEYTRFLVTPYSISGPERQSIGSIAYNMGWYCQSMFSKDGTRYARTSTDRDIILTMCFDRCTGLFSCPEVIDLKETGRQGPIALSFSPNGKVLYVNYHWAVYQIDLENNNKILFLEEFDGFEDPFAITFYRMILAPNDKIYFAAANSSPYLHVINKPDEVGLGCQFRQRGVDIDKTFGVGWNHYPNYRLFDVPNSFCDTLGIDAPPEQDPAPKWVPQEGISIMPNPAQDWLYLALEGCKSGQLRIYNAAGVKMYEQLDCEGPARIDLEVSHWPAGLYIADLYWVTYDRPYHITKKFAIVR